MQLMRNEELLVILLKSLTTIGFELSVTPQGLEPWAR